MTKTVRMEGERWVRTVKLGGGILWPGHKVKILSVEGSRVTVELIAPLGVKPKVLDDRPENH